MPIVEAASDQHQDHSQFTHHAMHGVAMGIASALKTFHPPHDATPGHFDRFDLNHDGLISPADCPFDHGSFEAKMWWDRVMEPYARASVTIPMKAKYGDKVVGAFPTHNMSGAVAMKPLVPGDAGPGQGDFEFLVQKLMIRQGLSEQQAARIAVSYNNKHFGA